MAGVLVAVQGVAIGFAADQGEPRGSNAAPKQGTARIALPSRKECLAWATLLHDAVERGDLANGNALIDWDAVLQTAGASNSDSPTLAKKQAEFIGQLKPALARHGIAFQMIDLVRSGGSFTFLRIRDILGRRRAVFRALTREGGLNYYEFILTSSEDKRVRAVDLYVVSVGQLQSEALRPGILAFVHSGLAEGRDRLNFLDKEFIAHAADLVAIADAVRANQPRRVLEIYERLPESLKRTKALLAPRLASAAKISQQDYLRAFDDFQRYHPDAPECDLIALNVFFVQRSYERALASVDRLDKALGGDPYLKVTRAVILLEQGKADTARQMAERAIAEEPTLIDAYEFLISHSIQTRNFAKTTELLSTVKSKFNWKVPDFTADPACAEFVKSEAYKAWIKSHGSRRAVPQVPSRK